MVGGGRLWALLWFLGCGGSRCFRRRSSLRITASVSEGVVITRGANRVGGMKKTIIALGAAGTLTATLTAAPAGADTASKALSAESDGSSSSGELSPGAIAGIVIGVLAAGGAGGAFAVQQGFVQLPPEVTSALRQWSVPVGKVPSQGMAKGNCSPDAFNAVVPGWPNSWGDDGELLRRQVGDRGCEPDGLARVLPLRQRALDARAGGGYEGDGDAVSLLQRHHPARAGRAGGFHPPGPDLHADGDWESWL